MKNDAVVYWIRLASHLDILTEGYVGVSKNFNFRMKRHATHTIKLNTHFANAIKKHTWNMLIKEIIFTGSIDDCFIKELELRKNKNIGWNESIGGLGGDRSSHINYFNIKHIGWNYDKTGNNNPFFGKKHTQSTKLKLNKINAKSVITTPDGIFYGIREVARKYNINRITAKKWTEKKEGWSIENISTRT